MKLVDLSGVCKARDHQNLGAVLGLLRAVGAICDCCSRPSDDINKRSEHGAQEMDDETDETLVCNRRKFVRSKHFKYYQIHTYF